MSRAALVAILAVVATASPAAAATRDVPFAPVAAPAAGTCPVGDAAAFRVQLASTAVERAALSPCLGTASPAGRLLLVAAPDEPQAGTVLEVVDVSVRGRGARRRLRVVVRLVPAPAGSFGLQVLTTPRAVVRLDAVCLARSFVLVAPGGAVLARGRLT